ncbi:AbrB/MazE/SpoVT family DNA-binding domain-containing protein [Candidatus Pacearchaeota archaeon]|nr:AbrB/MazE/SpoVT family DNA-binding domain-containing protein [Candidatus Pacearchaeota archaeon]
MAVEIKTKKWGNSIGIIIPNETIEKLNIKPNENVIVEIHKKGNVLKELWGAFKFKKDPHKLIKEVRKEFEGKWLR